jgi:hypothetical protein
MPYNPMMAMTNSQMRDQKMRGALQDFMGYFQSLKAQKDDAEKEAMMKQISGADPASTTGQAGGPQLGMDAAGMPTGVTNGPQGVANSKAAAAAKAMYAMKYGVRPYSAKDIANEDAVNAEKPKQALLQTAGLGQENTQRGQAIDLATQINPIKLGAAKTEADTGAFDLSQKKALGPLQLTQEQNKTLASGYEPAAAGAKVTLLGAQANEANANADKAAKAAILGKQPNKEQFDAAGFGRRMDQANAVFDKLIQGGYDRGSVSAGLGALAPNVSKSSQSQQQDQAERNFINATLRRESGAAISAGEFDNAEKQYFPRAGDSEEVKAQKAANRAQVMENMKASAGPAWEATPAVATPSAKPADIPQVTGESDYNALKPGQEYVDPNGKRRRKS